MTEVEALFLPSVVEAQYRGDFRIHLTFNDSSSKTVDFRSWLKGPIFAPLKQASYFRRFFLDGGTVVWPNGADIAPETLYEAAGVLERRPKRMRRTRSAQGGAALGADPGVGRKYTVPGELNGPIPDRWGFLGTRSPYTPRFIQFALKLYF